MPDAAATNASISWFPLLTALVGYLTSAITESFRDRRTAKREREAATAASARDLMVPGAGLEPALTLR